MRCSAAAPEISAGILRIFPGGALVPASAADRAEIFRGGVTARFPSIAQYSGQHVFQAFHDPSSHIVSRKPPSMRRDCSVKSTSLVSFLSECDVVATGKVIGPMPDAGRRRLAVA